MGILALYSRIDAMQREDHAVTVAEVKDIMDEAMSHSQKVSAKKLVKRVLGKNTDDADRIILTEKILIFRIRRYCEVEESTKATDLKCSEKRLSDETGITGVEIRLSVLIATSVFVLENQYLLEK